jgi:preprotein translocase subunit SecG
MQILFPILTTLFIVVSIALVLIILVQRPQGGGLTGAFGGGGGTDTAFGGRTGDALTVATITAFAIYLLIAIGLNITSNMARDAVAQPEAETATPADGGTMPAPAPATTDGTTTPAPAPATTDAPASSPSPDATPVTPAEPAPTAPAPQAPTDVNPNPTPNPTPSPAPAGG